MKMKKKLSSIAACLTLVAALSFLPTTATQAAVILTFGQVAEFNTVIATNPANGITTITGTDVEIMVNSFPGVAPATPFSAYFNLTATNTGPAAAFGGDVFQNYSGSFSITSGTGGTGLNYLSGTFTDLVTAAVGGPTLTMAAGDPPDTVVFTSNFFIAAPPGLGISLAFSDVSPLVSINEGVLSLPGINDLDDTIAEFEASVAGTFNADILELIPVPEPTTLAIWGFGALGMAVAGYRRRKLSRS
jgi:hypothetical protein